VHPVDTIWDLATSLPPPLLDGNSIVSQSGSELITLKSAGSGRPTVKALSTLIPSKHECIQLKHAAGREF
jgi:hypothetical protein